MDAIKLFLDSNRGIYIPQSFADMVDPDDWMGFGFEDQVILRHGPDHFLYWETWHDVLDNAIYHDEDGREWTLYQDGDLFLICAELMTPEQAAELLGVDI